MRKFYCIISDINNPANPDTFRLLKTAVENKGFQFVAVDALTTSPHMLKIEPDSMLYRLSSSPVARFLEAYVYRQDIATMYKDYDIILARAFSWGSTLRTERAGLPSIPTIYKTYLLNDEQLQQAVTDLGGFPIVVKGSGGSHGSDVKKADTFDELRELLADPLSRDNLALRKFIHHARHIRVVVVGNRAVDAIEYDVQPNDFRTNAVAVPTVQPFTIAESPEIAKTAVASVLSQGVEFGGVDILLQPDGEFYVAEVNFPCNFARNQMCTHVNIAELMVDHLASKY